MAKEDGETTRWWTRAIDKSLSRGERNYSARVRATVSLYRHRIPVDA